MKEITLLKAAIITILAGFAILLYSLSIQSASPSQKQDYSTSFPRQTIIRGTINDINLNDKTLFLTILGERIEPATVILFNSKKIELKEGDYVEITGTIESYNGKQEIVADRVTKNK